MSKWVTKKELVIQNDTGIFITHPDMFGQAMDEFGEKLVSTILGEVQKKAKENVSPGKGPGPHPHRVGSHHIDMGKLERSIEETGVRKKKENGIPVSFEGDVYTDVPYGYYLELGWVTTKHNVFRYPWMNPAAKIVFDRSGSIIKDIADNLSFVMPLQSVFAKMDAEIRRRSRMSGTSLPSKSYGGSYTR